MSAVPRAGGLALAAMATLGLAWASRLPMTAHDSSDALLRVAWSAAPERIEECRAPSAEAQAGRPRHMQEQLICTGTAATYRLEVRHDGHVLADQEVRGGGLRNDRRLYVFRDLAVPPRPGLLNVRFTRLGAGNVPTAFARRSNAVPQRLVLEQRVTFRSRQVTLVTYDDRERELVLVQAPVMVPGR